jgi:hypothetical protein
VDGPAKGYACTSLSYSVWDGNGNLSQWDQAKALDARANDNMARLAAQAGSETGKPNDIRFALPDQGAWSTRQAWNGDPWISRTTRGSTPTTGATSSSPKQSPPRCAMPGSTGAGAPELR